MALMMLAQMLQMVVALMMISERYSLQTAAARVRHRWRDEPVLRESYDTVRRDLRQKRAELWCWCVGKGNY